MNTDIETEAQKPNDCNENGAVLSPLDVLRRAGWCKGELEDEDGHLCIVGSLDRLFLDVESMTMNGPWATYRLAVTDVIIEQFPDRIDHSDNMGCIVPDFNDHPDTTFADVELVLEKAQLRFAESEVTAS